MNGVGGLDGLVATVREGLRDLTPGPEDAVFSELWGLFTTIVHQCGYRLLEENFGELTDAADEVRMFLEHFEKVERVARVLPVRVPKVIVLRTITLRNFLRDTSDRDEVVKFLKDAPTLIADMAEYVQRAGGRSGYALYELLLLVSSAGSVFQGFFHRMIPES